MERFKLVSPFTAVIPLFYPRIYYTIAALRGKYDEEYIDRIEAFANLCEKYGIYFYLDLHQDLYGGPSNAGDGAPVWACMTDGKKFKPVRFVWAEGYFFRKAVHRCFDNFWANKEYDGIGIQTRFLNMWSHLAERFKDRNNHELYCCRHFIEAAIAYHHATGKRKLLDIMEKYVDCIIRAFVTEKTADFATPGHEEIELALIKLWEHTEKLEYLKLARYFINLRGNNEKDRPIYNHTALKYEQSHEPVRNMREAVGHAVRAEYLYCAMADLARIDDKGRVDFRLVEKLDK